MSNELRDIRAGTARLCADWVRFIASENSADTTVFIDSTAGVENDHHFRGGELWFVDDAGTAANRGQIVRILESSYDEASLSLGPGLTNAPVAGDEAWAYNIGGSGDRIRTYDATINDAIRSLGQSASPVYSETLSSVWDATINVVDIPATFTWVGTAQYYDIDGNWNEIPSHGIGVDQVNKTLSISYEFAILADGYNVRLRGRKTHPPLINDSDTTDVDYEWLTLSAASSLLLQRTNQLLVNRGGMFKNAADQLRGKAGSFNMIEGMIRVR